MTLPTHCFAAGADLALIKVDIEGGEEFILEDLHAAATGRQIPLYVAFHVDWWDNKDLSRFSCLSDAQRHLLAADPFASILFPQSEFP